MTGLKVLSKSMGEEFKCGGCNWLAETAWYLEGEPEPEPALDNEDDERRLTSGLCAHCLLETLQAGCLVVPKGMEGE